MSFSGKIKAIMALLMATGTCAMAAKSTSARVIDRLGDAKFQKKTNIGEWNEIYVGTRVNERDQIHTGIESSVALVLSDGSTITVQEISLVEFTTLQIENGAQTVFTDVKTGKVRFNAQKQRSGGSFNFKTSTAIAAIRGTSGIFGQTPKATFMALANGNALLQTPQGLECEVNGGQTVYIRPDAKKCHTINAKSSGSNHFQELLEQLIDDPNKSDDQIIKEAQQADSEIQAEFEKIKDKFKCHFDSVKDTITANYLTITGSCSKGVSLTLDSKTFQDARRFEYTADWDAGISGEKKFPATCSVEIETKCQNTKKNSKASQTCKKQISADCGLITTYYQAQNLAPTDSLEITTPSPTTVCEPGAVTIEGRFDPTDTEGSLFVKIGEYKSKNLVPLSVNGEFEHTVSISDALHNWNEKEAVVEYTGKKKKYTKKLALNIKKNCPQVNQLPPVVSLIHSDSLKCEALFSLQGANDHWLNPQLRLISMLTEHYHCKSAFVFHSEVTNKYINKYNVKKYIMNTNRIGCRSKTNSEILKENLSLSFDPFVCPSGIPDQYIENQQVFGKTIRDRELQVICAGRLVNYKRIDAVIESCAGFDKNEIGQLTIVGEGQLREELEECAKKNGVFDRIVFTGRVERDTLIKKMYQSDIFALISEREVFGLVYLEAMLQGCIVIAAKGGGVDGIIIDGVNGFLCEQGDSKELSGIISKILRMTDAERKQISEKAAATAAQYSDSQVAKNYLSNIME